jgi:hypothetical protein
MKNDPVNRFSCEPSPSRLPAEVGLIEVPASFHTRHRGERPGLSFALAALLTLGWEGWLLTGVMRGEMWLWQAMALHPFPMLLLGVWIARRRGKRKDNRFPLMLLLTTAVLGPFGAVGSILAGVLYGWYRWRALSFDEWFASLFPDRRREASEEVAERLSIGYDEWSEPSQVVPFTDVMALGTTTQKRRVIALMAQDFRPEYASALHQALTDPVNAVRVQAGSAMASLEQKFHLQLQKSKRQLEQQGSVAAYRHHADLLRDMAASGVFDPDRTAQLRLEAAHTYDQLIAHLPNDTECRLERARLAATMEDWEGVIAVLEDTYYENPLPPGEGGAQRRVRDEKRTLTPALSHRERGPSANDDALDLLLTAYAETGDYARARWLAGEMGGTTPLSQSWAAGMSVFDLRIEIAEVAA